MHCQVKGTTPSTDTNFKIYRLMESIKKVERYLQTRKKSDSRKFFLKFRFRNVEKDYELGCETVKELNRAMRHIDSIMPMWRAELWIDGKKEI